MSHRDCPFCGADESRLRVVVDAPSAGTMRAHVSCLDCGAGGPTVPLGDERMEAEDLPAMVRDAESDAWRLWEGEWF